MVHGGGGGLMCATTRIDYDALGCGIGDVLHQGGGLVAFFS
jgi:hypothetical protein